VDASLLVAIDVNGVKPAITAAKKAGIPVVAIDAQIPAGTMSRSSASTNTKAGEDIGKFYADYVKSDLKGAATVGVVGALNSFIQNQRLDGFKKAASASGADIKFLDTVDGKNVQDVALGAAENLMTANPDMQTIYATGEPASRRRRLRRVQPEQDRLGEGLRLGSYWRAPSKGSTRAGSSAVVQQDPAGEGKAAIEALTTLQKAARSSRSSTSDHHRHQEERRSIPRHVQIKNFGKRRRRDHAAVGAGISIGAISYGAHGRLPRPNVGDIEALWRDPGSGRCGADAQAGGGSRSGR